MLPGRMEADFRPALGRKFKIDPTGGEVGKIPVESTAVRVR